MTEQLRLFALTADELAQKTALVVEYHREDAGLRDQLKTAQERLRDSAEYAEVTDIKKQIRFSRERLLATMAELGAAKRD